MFSPGQKKVIEDFSGNILLLARAGSGKTFCVANKIARALGGGMPPEKILCVTFTVKAAGEIRADVAKYYGECTLDVHTIHGFCFSLVREYAKRTGEFREPDIADEVDAGELISDVLIRAADKDDYRLTDGKPMLPPRQLGKIFSFIKHRRDELGYDWFSRAGYSDAVKSLLEDTPEFLRSFSVRKFGVKITDYGLIDLLTEKADEYVGEYARLLASSDLMDFDDLIFCAKALLKKSDMFRGRYSLVIVDEMQDTSMAEYSVMRNFFEGACVLMCGDDCQTIYGWRGSEPRKIIDDFTSNFGAETVTIDGNRRSSGTLAYAGSYYLAKTFGYPMPEKPDPVDGRKITVAACRDEETEADEVFRILSSYAGERSDICVMARSNRYIAELYGRMEKINASLPPEKRIAFFTADKDFQFYKKPIVKDFLAFFRLIVNRRDVAAFERVAEKYVRDVGRGLLGAVRDYGAEGVSVSSFLCEDSYSRGDEYFSLVDAYRKSEIVVYDLETTGLDTAKDEMIQISAVKFGDGGVRDELNVFAIPNVPMTAGAERVHGYGKDKLLSLGAVSVKEALSAFSHFSRGCVLVGHNSAAFDDVILNRCLAEYGVESSFGARYDTMIISGLFLPGLADHKLATLCSFFGVENVRAHDALSDVNATKDVLKELIEGYLIPTEKVRTGLIIKHRDKFRKLYKDISTMEEMLCRGDVYGLIRFIDAEYGLISSPTDRASANDLYLAVSERVSGGDVLASTREFLSEAALSGSQMDVMIKRSKKVALITVHQSKGCEFDEVILAGAGENDFPSYGAKASGNEEEEKRVFYVALTRAKNKLYITYPESKTFGAKTYARLPSPYIAYLPAEMTERKKV